MDTEKVLAIAKNAGFSQVGELDCDTIRLMPEVRKMVTGSSVSFGIREMASESVGKQLSSDPVLETVKFIIEKRPFEDIVYKKMI